MTFGILYKERPSCFTVYLLDSFVSLGSEWGLIVLGEGRADTGCTAEFNELVPGAADETAVAWFGVMTSVILPQKRILQVGFEGGQTRYSAPPLA
jgi:hypothetical protein